MIGNSLQYCKTGCIATNHHYIEISLRRNSFAAGPLYMNITDIADGGDYDNLKP